MNKLKNLTKGFLEENPVLVLLLGTCPSMATSTVAKNGVGMGIAATFVLLGSNIAISALKKVIPDKVRIPCYIVLIAGFVTIVSLLVQAFFPDLYNALGIFLPLIVVNCIILGRAEMFAGKNGVMDSALDAIGMGLGFTLALLTMGTIREILGSGTWFGMKVLPFQIEIFKMAPGGFFVFGCVIALATKIKKMRSSKKNDSGCSDCSGCASAGNCAAE